MKILFVIAPDNNSEKYILKESGNYDTLLPLGIAQLAAVMKNKGHEIKAIDLRLRKNKRLSLEHEINDFNPDAISLSSYFYSIKNLFRTASIIKKVTRAPIVIGGISPSLPPYKIISNKFSCYLLKESQDIDLVITGEGEIIFERLLNRIRQGKKYSGLSGVSFRDKKGSIIKSKKSKKLVNIEKLPFPFWGIFCINDYIPLPKHYKRIPVIPISASRGCLWGKCSFCPQPNINGYYRFKSPRRVISEIKYLARKYKAKELRFWDDNFIHGRKWILDFSNMLAKEKLGLIWSCHARTDMVDSEILRAMKKAGCWQIMYGIESADPTLLCRINKGINLKDAENAVKKAKSVGLEVRASFILGLPGETPDKGNKTIKFARKLGADIIQISYMTPYPETKTYEKLKNSERLDKNLFNYCEYKVVYLPKAYKSRDHLESIYKKAYRQIYLSPYYISKQFLSIRAIEDLRRNYSGFKEVLGMSFKKKRI